METIKKIYHPHNLWEEVAFNMWGSVENRSEYLQKAIKFTGNHRLYGIWMIKVTKKWKYSCEHNLSDLTQNRKAWLGHAACAFAFGCPEDIVREAWGFLSPEQQVAANKAAESAIKKWEKKHAKTISEGKRPRVRHKQNFMDF